MSLGWIGNVKAENISLCDVHYSSSVLLPEIPPWLFQEPSVDFNIQNRLKEKSGKSVSGVIVQRSTEQNH